MDKRLLIGIGAGIIAYMLIRQRAEAFERNMTTSKCPYNLPPHFIDKNEVLSFVKQNATIYGIDPALVMAIIEQESGFNANACRCEPIFYKKYIYPSNKYKSNPFYNDTCAWGSWGLMQILYSNALKYIPAQYKNIHPKDLMTRWKTNILIGLDFLKELKRRSNNINDIISMYNSGRRYNSAPSFTRNIYVPSVLRRLEKWSKIIREA